jgi:hypothetical protein
MSQEYPDGLNLNPDGDLHRKLVTMVMAAARRGRSAGKEARDRAEEIDRTLKTFVPAEWSEDFLAMRNTHNPKAPMEIVVPVSKNVLDTFMTYMAGSFFTDSNLYYLRGRGGKTGTIRAALFEQLLNTQAVWFQHDLSFMTFWRDAFAHGIGCLIPEWAKHTRREPVIEEVSDVLSELLKQADIKTSSGDLLRYLEERVVHEGNRLHACNPYTLILDTNVPLQEQERAEYCGWIETTNAGMLMKRATDPENRLFNVDRLRDVAKNRGGLDLPFLDTDSDYGYPRLYQQAFPGYNSESCRVVHLFMRVVPRELKIGESSTPEVIEFVVGEGEVLIGLNRTDYDHGRLPMVFGSPSADGHESWPLSELGSAYGLQQFCDWKLRAQVANQSKVLNDMLLVDPSVFEEEDLLNPAPGKLIRAKRSLYGLGGIDQYVRQLNVNDVTGGNLNDVVTMMSLMNQVVGTSDITMGNMSNMPERPTAQLGMAARNAALSRLQFMAQKMVSQTQRSLISMLASNTLQFMGQDVMLDIVGNRFEDEIRAELGLSATVSDIMVSPWALDMEFEVEPRSQMSHDGDLAAMSAVVERMLSVPEIAMDAFSGLDIRGLIMSYIRKAGFSNVQDYVKKNEGLPGVQATQMPDEEVMAQQQAGNLVPTEEVMA